MMLDDTRCGLDVSSLHRATSMDISLSKNFCLLSCHRDTSSNSFYPISKTLGVLFQHSSRNSSFVLKFRKRWVKSHKFLQLHTSVIKICV